MYSLSDLAQALDRGLEHGEDLAGQVGGRRPGLVEILEDQPERERNGDEFLLGPVVQVALDPAARSVSRVDDAGARSAQLAHPGLLGLLLPPLGLGLPTGADVEDRPVEPCAPVRTVHELAPFQHPHPSAV